ncbi:MAG: S8 family serine peptidase [candidate division SR1 bacterium]|nr:S8 family serine peptidase [candidate division SR1 bacterium]
MIDFTPKDLEAQENKHSLPESSFDNEANKQGLADIENESIKVHKQQNKKAEQLEALLDIKDTMKISPSILRTPPPEDFVLQKITEAPSYDANNKDPFQIDARYCDLSEMDILKNSDILPHAMFSNLTKRPKNIEKYFNPKSILENNKTPGLHIKDIHKKGITGKGINIAIIDQALLIDHEEYKGKIKMYDEIDEVNTKATMHSAAVTSIAVGKNIGVAPDANIYYIGGIYAERNTKETYIKMDNIAEGIYKIIKKNKELDTKNKIRAISISYGITDTMQGYDICKKAIDEAEKQGIYVIYPDDKNFMGALRDPKDNPDVFESYFKALKNEPRLKALDKKNRERLETELIFVPMNSRTLASPTGNEDYTFDRYGGISRVMPYVAGIYALCCQIQPDITKEIFIDAVKKTAEVEEIEGMKFKMINPEELIKYLEKS